MNPKQFTMAMAVAGLQLSVSAVDSMIPSIAEGRLVPQPAGTLAGHAALALIVQAGHPTPDPSSGILPDSPVLRVDANTITSPFAGVGSLFADDDPSDPFGVLCTAIPIDRWHVLTAGHCLDITNGDGKSDVLPENVLFVLNYGAGFSHIIPASAIAVHPNYDGIAALSFNDDLAVLTLSEPLPDGVPIYPLAKPTWLDIAPVILSGYGTSGDGVNGYYVDASFQVKRTGANLLEYAELDDEGGPQVEVIAWDFEFEGDPDRFDVFGIPLAFPNQVETTMGGGDSGGPTFMYNPSDPLDPNLYLAGVNAFTFWIPGEPDHDQPGKFGSGSGGVWLNSEYQKWICAASACPGYVVTRTDPGQCSAVVNYDDVATHDCPGVVVVCDPPSGSTFPVGTTTVTCTATEAGGNTATCSFNVTVNDTEPPVASYAVVKAAALRQNPLRIVGWFQLLTTDNCDPDPLIYIKGSVGSFVAGPFHNGDQVEISHGPSLIPRQAPSTFGGNIATIQLNGDVLLWAVDSSGNPSTQVKCR